jgi:hypothetical protein
VNRVRPHRFAIVLAIVASAALSLGAQESADPDVVGQRWGGPDKVENQLRDDAEVDRPTVLNHWFDWKTGLVEKYGLSFGVDYSAAGLRASETPGDDSAAGGMIRFFGSWDLIGQGTNNTGAMIWKVEHRHAYTDVAPSIFSFELGAIGLIEPPFSDQGTRLTNLYWRQRLAAHQGHRHHPRSAIPAQPVTEPRGGFHLGRRSPIPWGVVAFDDISPLRAAQMSTNSIAPSQVARRSRRLTQISSRASRLKVGAAQPMRRQTSWYAVPNWNETAHRNPDPVS